MWYKAGKKCFSFLRCFIARSCVLCRVTALSEKCLHGCQVRCIHRFWEAQLIQHLFIFRQTCKDEIQTCKLACAPFPVPFPSCSAPRAVRTMGAPPGSFLWGVRRAPQVGRGILSEDKEIFRLHLSMFNPSGRKLGFFQCSF